MKVMTTRLFDDTTSKKKDLKGRTVTKLISVSNGFIKRSTQLFKFVNSAIERVLDSHKGTMIVTRIAICWV